MIRVYLIQLYDVSLITRVLDLSDLLTCNNLEIKGSITDLYFRVEYMCTYQLKDLCLLNL